MKLTQSAFDKSSTMLKIINVQMKQEGRPDNKALKTIKQQRNWIQNHAKMRRANTIIVQLAIAHSIRKVWAAYTSNASLKLFTS